MRKRTGLLTERLLAVLSGLFLAFLLAVTGYVKPALAAAPRVIDDADLLSSSEEAALNEQVSTFIDKTGMDLVLMTIDDAQGKTSMEYADDYYDYNGYGIGSEHSGALLLIDMDNREIYLSTTGNMIDAVSDSDRERVFDAGYDALLDGDYYTCLSACTDKLMDYARGNFVSPVEGGVSAVAGAGAGLAVRKRVKQQYKTKRQSVIYPYRDYTSMALRGNQDLFINTYVTTRVIPVVTSSGKTGGGGGHSTHIGSSGTHHGGGGRKF